MMDEKWIYYNNPKHKKWCRPGKPSSTAKPNIHDAKPMLCI